MKPFARVANSKIGFEACKMWSKTVREEGEQPAGADMEKIEIFNNYLQLSGGSELLFIAFCIELSVCAFSNDR